jgi:hypothetical protein
MEIITILQILAQLIKMSKLLSWALAALSNDFRLLLNFIDMIYIIIASNPTVDFIIRLSGKELSEVSRY